MIKQLSVTTTLVSILILSAEFAPSEPIQQSQGQGSYWQLIERIKKTWYIRRYEIVEQLRKDPVGFTHRQLSAEEVALISECLKFIKDPKQDLGERGALLIELQKYPHVSMLSELVEIAKQRPPDEEPWRTLTVRLMETAVTAIGRIADERAIEALIELIGSPAIGVRLRSLEQLQKLLGKQLPQGYRWGDYRLDTNHPICTEEGHKQGLETLWLWWQQNKGKVKIYWQGVWWYFCS